MDINAIVLLLVLVLFFLLFAFLAVVRAATRKHEAFPVYTGFFPDCSQALALQKLREKCFEKSHQVLNDAHGASMTYPAAYLE